MQIFPGFDVRILEDIGGIDSPLESMIEAKGYHPARPSPDSQPVADDTRTDFALERSLTPMAFASISTSDAARKTELIGDN